MVATRARTVVIHCMMTAICSCELWDLLVQVWVGLSILCGYLEKESLDHLPMLFLVSKGTPEQTWRQSVCCVRACWGVLRLLALTGQEDGLRQWPARAFVTIGEKV
jgi:hypothetical protein